MIYDKLYDTQKKVHDKFKDWNNLGFGLYLSMACGKTLISLSLAEHKNFKKVIVVCPSSAKTNWEKNIIDELGIKPLILGKTKVKDEKNLKEFKEGYIITTYQTIWRRPILEKKVIDKDTFIIIDESHNLNNKGASQTKWFIKHAQKFGLIALLSGTPVSSGDKWWPQLKLMGDPISYKEFEENFCIVDMKKMNGYNFKQIIGTKNQDFLLEEVKKNSIFMKTEEIVELPEKVFNNIYLEMDGPSPTSDSSYYKRVGKEMIFNGDIIKSKGILYGVRRRMSSGFYKDVILSKHKEVALEDFLDSSNDNVIIFYNWNEELSAIKRVAEKMGIKIFQVNGSANEYEESYNYKGRFILATHYVSGGASLNLQHVNNVLYYSPTDEYINYEQSTGRIARPGQKNRCFYYHFITKDTVEEKKIYPALARKQSYTAKMYENENED